MSLITSRKEANELANARALELTRTRGVGGALTALKAVWTYEVEDITKVPTHLLQVNDAAVRADDQTGRPRGCPVSEYGTTPRRMFGRWNKKQLNRLNDSRKERKSWLSCAPPPGASGESFTPILAYKAPAGRLYVRDRVQNASGDWETTETDITMAQPAFALRFWAIGGRLVPLHRRRGTAMEHGAVRTEDAGSAAIAR